MKIIIRECPTGVCMKRVGNFFLMSNRNKSLKKLSESLFTSSLFSVRLCYNTTLRP